MTESEKRRVGRPSMAEEERRHISASMYLSKAEHDAFMTVVDASGMSASNFIRHACAAAIVVDSEDGGDTNE